MNAPERIWVEPDYDHGWTYPRGEWSIACPWPHADAVEYVRADRIAAMEAERDDYREKWVRDTGKLAVYAEQQEDRAHRLEAEVARLRSLVGRYIHHVGEEEGTDFLGQDYSSGTLFIHVGDQTPEREAFDALMALSDAEKDELAQIGIEVHNAAAART